MITVLGLDGGAYDQNSLEPCNGRFLRQVVLLKFSSSYVAGGDTLDLTNAGGSASAPNIIPPAEVRGLADIIINPLATTNSSLSAINGSYIPIIPSAVVPVNGGNLAKLKVKIYVGAGTEYVAGAYGTDVLADVVQAELVWAR